LLPLLWKRLYRKDRSRSDGVTGISLEKTGMCLAHVQTDEGGAPRLLHGGFYPCKEHERAPELTLVLKSLGLSGSCGRLILDRTDYRVFQAPIPDVPPGEVREALRWRMQELLDFPADEAEIEYFPIPSTSKSGGGGMVNAVVCHKTLLQSHSALCETAGIELEAIDIAELALRNLAVRLPESEQGVALLHLEETRGIVQLQKGGVVYISRNLDFGARQMDATFSLEDNSPGGGVIDRLALEIQRSLDYYESHFGMSPIARLVVAPIAGNTQDLVDRLNRALGMIARAMDVSALIPCSERLDDATQQRCLPAIGVALGRMAQV